AHEGVGDLRTPLGEGPVYAPVDQVELLERGRPEAVDQDGDLLAVREGEVLDKLGHEAVGDLIGGLERAAVVTRYAVDPADALHLAVVGGEGGLAGRGEDGGGETDAHSAGAIHGALGDLGDGVETVAALRRGAGGLVGEEQPGHAASGGGLL